MEVEVKGEWSVKCDYRATLKKSLFPVQRVAESLASRAAAKSFFSPFVSYEKIVKILSKKKKNEDNEKKSSQSALL